MTWRRQQQRSQQATEQPNWLIVIGLIVLILWLKGGVLPIPVPNPVDPAPFPSSGLRVLIVEETGDRGKLPASQRTVFTSVKLREWLNANCQKEGDDAGWRILDKDADMQFASETWKQAMQLPRQSTPWLIASNGRSGVSCPLPQTVDEVIATLEAYK